MQHVGGEPDLDDYGQRVLRDFLNSRVIALFLESTLFGMFAVTYSIGIATLLRENQPSSMLGRNRILLGVSTVIFGLATAHLALTVKLTLYGFVINRDAFRNSSHLVDVYELAQLLIYVTQTLIGDIFMICRLYAAWDGKRGVVALPIILVFIDAVGGYGTVVFGLLTTLVFFSFSFFTNILCTILIMWRLLQSDRLLHRHWRWYSRVWFNIRQYHRLVEAIVQSAAIYSTASIALVVTFFLSPNIGFPMCLSAFSQLIGVVFSLITIQLARKSGLNTPSGED